MVDRNCGESPHCLPGEFGDVPAADDDSGSKECQCQTDISGDALRGMEEEMKRLMLENSSLNVHLASAQLTESSLAGNDNKVNFLTDLPTHHILVQLVNFVSQTICLSMIEKELPRLTKCPLSAVH